jgi:hypothetical protein
MIRGISIRGRWQQKITGKDHRKRSWEKREVNQDIHRDAHREAVYPVAHREAVYRDVYQEVNWKVTDAMFRTTSLRSIYKSKLIADDYWCVWYRTKITDIVWIMWKHCTRARKSTSALKYMVSITTYWDADMIDMPCTIDDHRRLRNMLAVEAPIDDESSAEAPIDTEWRAEALPSRKVDLRLDWRLFHFAFG